MDLFKGAKQKLTQDQKDSVQKLYNKRDGEYKIPRERILSYPYKLSKQESDLITYQMASIFAAIGISYNEKHEPLLERNRFDEKNPIDRTILLERIIDIHEDYISLVNDYRDGLMEARKKSWSPVAMDIVKSMYEYSDNAQFLMNLNKLDIDPEELINIHRERINGLIQEITKGDSN